MLYVSKSLEVTDEKISNKFDDSTGGSGVAYCSGTDL